MELFILSKQYHFLKPDIFYFTFYAAELSLLATSCNLVLGCLWRLREAALNTESLLLF